MTAPPSTTGPQPPGYTTLWGTTQHGNLLRGSDVVRRLPIGAPFVRAANGAREELGFSRTGGETAMAVLKPVGVVGAAAFSWPLFAVGATVMAVDAIARREQRAHQDKLESILDQQQRQHYKDRITTQRTADRQLSRAIRLMLDGRKAQLDNALENAFREFDAAQQFLHAHQGVVDPLVDEGGKVDYRRLEAALSRATGSVDSFFRELQLAQSAIAMWRKALIADAALAALADPPPLPDQPTRATENLG